ncbi:unnamed protein product [Clonostachys rosea f. rosea IK726]|uniref:Uncharacterized protein n=2 Tax=Bionectria ochroleuca TaxID=29856 RepID=A0A0B7KJN3_BIOOC|nr:unnamed protein product [Clonostachys rosea f. rosea IK726]
MTPFKTQLLGDHVLVTGGNKGIGRVIVESFLAEGANVSYCSRSASEDDFATFHGAIEGAKVLGTKVDVGNQEEIRAWVENSAENYGRIDAVVANAYAIFPSSSIDDWQQSLEGNTIGLVTLIETAAPYLIARAGTGSLIVLSSVSGFELRSSNPTGPQSVVKRSQAIIAKSYSKVLGQKGVRVNTVTPGLVETPNLVRADGTEQLSSFQLGKKLKPEFMRGILDQVPLGRPGQSQEVANAVVFLASALSGYINGANLLIDGGFSVTL